MNPASVATLALVQTVGGRVMARVRNLLLAVVFAAIPWPASASQPTDSDPAEVVPDATAKKAATALVHILEIEQTYSIQLDAAQTQRDAKAVIDRMAGDAVNAIRQQGLSPAEYKHVMAVAESDPELQDRLLTAAKSAQ